MPRVNKKIAFFSLLTTAAAILGSCMFHATGAVNAVAATEDAKDPAVERARREVKMLDDIYKTAIVLVTEHYFHDDNDLPAGILFVRPKIVPIGALRQVDRAGFAWYIEWCRVRHVVHGICDRVDKQRGSKHILIVNVVRVRVAAEIKWQGANHGVVFLRHHGCERIDIWHQAIAKSE